MLTCECLVVIQNKVLIQTLVLNILKESIQPSLKGIIMADNSAVIDSLKSRFDPEAAKGMDDIFQFNISDADDYYLIVQDGSMAVHQGEHDDPSVTLSTDTATLKGVMNGDINGMQAFMSGKLKASGNLMLATKLSSLFPSH